MLTPVTSSALSGILGIRHAFFTREGGVSAGLYASLNGGLGSQDERALVLENRRRMAAHMGVSDERFLNVWQIHSADVVAVDSPWTTDERPKADAMVTATPHLSIAVATADCGPVLFADANARVIGAAHAGWQGAFHGVLEATLDAMEAQGARRSAITAVIGPMLSQRNYEVGPEFVARFLAQDADNARFFVPSNRESHAMFDLPAYNTMRLTKAGVGQVQDLAMCTYADEQRFYSYRRATHRKEADYGRLLAAIAITA
ncbi:MAG: peptidoglycan editing factor PgeF [Beijerinckiaceae bacterium]